LTAFTEVGRFFAIAAIVAASSVVPLAVLTLSSVGNPFFVPFAFVVVVGITFLIAVIAGVLIGLPLLQLVKALGWDYQPWKLSALGLVAGTFTVAAIILIFSDGVGSSEFWTVVFPPYATFGGFGGLVAALSWYWMHRKDRAFADV
jgi:hypothetical protein